MINYKPVVSPIDKQNRELFSSDGLILDASRIVGQTKTYSEEEIDEAADMFYHS